MSRPLVSIVIAAYRSRHDHLAAAIASALGQTWREIEVIVTDDSPDEGVAIIVAGFADTRLRYRRNVPSLGVAANHAAGFAETNGRYVAILNHDDQFRPAFVATLVGALEAEPRAVLAFCDHWIIDAEGVTLEADTASNSKFWGRAALAPGLHRPFFELVVNQSVPMAMGTLFRRSAMPSGWATVAGPAYDLWLSYLLCRGQAGALYLPERLGAWRTHGSNLTSQGGVDWLLGAAECWHAMARDPSCGAVHEQARQRAARAFQACAVGAWRARRRLECARYAVRSLREKATLRGVAALALALWPFAWRLQWSGIAFARTR